MTLRRSGSSCPSRLSLRFSDLHNLQRETLADNHLFFADNKLARLLENEFLLTCDMIQTGVLQPLAVSRLALFESACQA